MSTTRAGRCGRFRGVGGLRPHLVLLLSAFASAPGAFAAQTTTVTSLEYPVHKLYTICADQGSFPVLTTTEREQFAKSFVLVQGAFSEADRAALKAVSGALPTKFTKYMNSTYTEANIGAVTAAEQIKGAIAMTYAAQLSQPIVSTAQTTLQVTTTLPALPIKASTVAGAYSQANSTANYVFWIQIGSERMKVTGVTGAGPYTLTVTRGFDGTSPLATAAAGAKLYSPVYAGAGTGNGGGTDGNYPGGNASEIRYCLDPTVVAGNQNRSDIVLDYMADVTANDKFDGAWLDTCNTGNFNLCDANGVGCRPWKMSAGIEFPETEFRNGQDTKMDLMQTEALATYGKAPVLVANNLRDDDIFAFAGTSPNSGDNQMMAWLIKGTAAGNDNTPIDGFCMEDYFQRARSATNFPLHLEALRQSIAQNLPVMPVLQGAGSGSILEELDNADRHERERFAYAFYLMAVRQNHTANKSVFGTYAFYSEDPANPGYDPRTGRYFKINPQYRWPIGAALTDIATSPLANDTDFVTADPNLYRREFENAVVLVHKGGNNAYPVSLGGYYIDPEATPATYVNSVTMANWSGKILLRQPKPLPIAPWVTTDFGTTGSAPDNGFGYGSSNSTGTQFTIAGSGAGIAASGSIDAMRWMYRTDDTNVTLTARIASISGGTTNNSQVGVIIRGSNTNPGAKYAACVVTKTNGVKSHIRTATGGAATTVTTSGLAAPYWVRVQRTGDTYKTFRSSNGTSWTQIGATTTMTNGSTSYIGFVATNTGAGGLVEGVIDNVSITN